MTFSMIAAAKGLYEVIEWFYGAGWENTIGVASFLGMQGDIWDAQKDMGLGMIGAILSGLWIWIRDKMKILK